MPDTSNSKTSQSLAPHLTFSFIKEQANLNGAILNFINGSVTSTHAHCTISDSPLATCVDAASSRHLDFWHVIFSSSLCFPHSFHHSFSRIAFFFFFSVLQFQPHSVMDITGIPLSCLVPSHPVWLQPVLFLWSSFKCQPRTKIKSLFTLSIRSPSWAPKLIGRRRIFSSLNRIKTR